MCNKRRYCWRRKLLDLVRRGFNSRVDMNVIGTDEGEFGEIQGTGEEAPFNRKIK